MVGEKSLSNNCFIKFKKVDLPVPPIPVVINITSSSGWNNNLFIIINCFLVKGKANLESNGIGPNSLALVTNGNSGHKSSLFKANKLSIMSSISFINKGIITPSLVI